MEKNCPFCRIGRGELTAKIRFEDEEILAFDDIHPGAPTHILVIPKRHISGLSEATEAGDRELVLKTFWRAKLLAAELDLENPGYRLLINNGSWAGQIVAHLHLHLLSGKKIDE